VSLVSRLRSWVSGICAPRRWYRGDHVLLAELNTGLSRHTPERRDGLYAELLNRLSRLPGVQAVSVADAALLGSSQIGGLTVEGVETTASPSGARLLHEVTCGARLPTVDMADRLS
jgi:hypothetical protein